jgi:hypothetical protein
VRRHYESRTEWFETDLAWNPRDAMEISSVRSPSSLVRGQETTDDERRTTDNG